MIYFKLQWTKTLAFPKVINASLKKCYCLLIFSLFVQFISAQNEFLFVKIHPESIADTIPSNQLGLSGGWAGEINTGIKGALVYAPEDATGMRLLCDTPSVDFTDKIVLIDRGACFFSRKAFQAQQMGAIGVIIRNVENTVVNMAINSNGMEVDIPVIMIPYDMGIDMEEALLNGETVEVGFFPELDQIFESCTERDSLALVEFYQAMGGDNWINNTNWLTNAPLNEWYGVTTNAQGCVSILELDGSIETNSIVHGNGLNGTLPDELWTLTDLEELAISDGSSEGVISGRIDDKLLNLTKLKKLLITGGGNQLIDGFIPENINRLKKLESIFLSKNRLTGPIPASIGDLENLKSISLYNNRLSGILPIEISKLKNLTSLNIYGNQFIGNIPPQYGQLEKLGKLGLGYNNLIGEIPVELSNLKELWSLGLSHNGLSGTIPPALGLLSKLSYLSLNDNQLTGPIPASLGTLKHIKIMNLASNNLSGCFPESFTNLCYLTTDQPEYFSCQWNDNEIEGCQYDFRNNPNLSWGGDFARFCSGEIQTNSVCYELLAEHPWLSNHIDLQNCINENILVYKSIGQIYLRITTSENTILYNKDGQLYCTYTENYNCEDFYPIEEIIFEWNCDCEQRDRAILIEFYQAMDGDNWINNDNWLTKAPLNEWYGVETNAGGCVSVLDLDGIVGGNIIGGGNGLNGVLPTSLWQLKDLEDLSILESRKGTLRGIIDEQLLQLTNLRHLLISGGRDRLITGNIPTNIGQLTKLESIFLSNNRLTGPLPASIGDLEKLTFISLYNNRLSGNLPVEIGKLKDLSWINIFGNTFTGSIPPQYGQLEKLWLLGLGRNNLTGEIPVELSNLKELHSLGINKNYLSGIIPAELGQLTQLVSLSLSDNELSGPIPASFGALKNMEWLNLSNNNLSGCFPDSLRNLCYLTTDLQSNFNCQWNDNEFEGCQYDFRNNPGLPNDGDFASFCNSTIGNCEEETNCMTPDFKEQGAIPITSKGSSFCLAIDDLDNDGDLDIVRGGYTHFESDSSQIVYKYNFSWLRNDGNNNYTEIIFFENSSASMRDVGINDFDKDGDLDIVALFDSKLVVYEQTSNSTFVERILPSDTEFIKMELADMDNDNFMDIVIVSLKAHRLSWFKNLGNLVFKENIIATDERSLYDIHIDDINQDGFSDIVANRIGITGEISVHYNDGLNNFTKEVIADNLRIPSRVISGKYNADNLIDFMVLSLEGSVYYLENLGNNQFEQELILQVAENDPKPYDFNNFPLDNSSQEAVLLFFNSIGTAKPEKLHLLRYENGGFANRVIDDATRVNKCPTVIDFDKDGLLDIVASSENSSNIRWFKQRNCGGLTPPFIEIVESNVQLSKDNHNLRDMKVLPSYPNPFSLGTTIPIIAPQHSLIQLRVFSPTGQLIYRKKYGLEEGRNELQLDDSVFPVTGLYFYQINNGQEIFSGMLNKH